MNKKKLRKVLDTVCIYRYKYSQAKLCLKKTDYACNMRPRFPMGGGRASRRSPTDQVLIGLFYLVLLTIKQWGQVTPARKKSGLSKENRPETLNWLPAEEAINELLPNDVKRSRTIRVLDNLNYNWTLTQIPAPCGLPMVSLRQGRSYAQNSCDVAVHRRIGLCIAGKTMFSPPYLNR